jgi:predicted RNA methylase
VEAHDAPSLILMDPPFGLNKHESETTVSLSTCLTVMSFATIVNC